MSSMVADLVRWLDGHVRRFADLPTIQVRPAPTPEGHPDHDDGFALDLEYMGELVERICSGALLPAEPWTDAGVVEWLHKYRSLNLAASHILEVCWPPWPKDDVAEALSAWRVHRDWAFGEARYYLTHGGPKWVTP